MVKTGYCSVAQCKDRESTRHRFPDPNTNPALFKKWLQACGNEKLLSMTPEQVHKTRKVCHLHFTPEDRSTNMYLKKGAYPVLHLPSAISAPIAEAGPLKETVIPEPTTFPIAKQCFEEMPSTSYSISTQSASEEQRQDIVCTPVHFMHTESDSISKTSALLKDVGVTREIHLTPKARKLYKRATTLTKTLRTLKSRRSKLHKRRLYKEFSKDEMLDQIISPMLNSVATFVRCQINQSTRKPHGRRYTLDEKILGLILHKQSGRAYRTMEKMFYLPSRRTLSILLSRIPITAGINESIFDNLKANVMLLQPRDRLCTLMFDEMALEPHINLNVHTSQFEGFEDTGDDEMTGNIADHVLLFMLKGITKSWKQPIVYTFCKSSTKTIDLVRLLKTIIYQCQQAGLKILATVSDQGTTNCAAVNYLTKYNSISDNFSDDLKIFQVNEQRIIHIYDPPHLLKGIRNNVLNKHLVWKKNGILHTAKWDHIINVYKFDNASGNLRLLPRLTDSHVIPDKLKKMKVSYAAQVFSYSVASVMQLLSSVKDSGLDKSATETAGILAFFDKLFDSVNGNSLLCNTKELKCAVTGSSGHIEYWKNTRKALKNMYFIKPETNEKVIPPSIRNWIYTLAGMEELQKMLKANDVSFFKPRFINQDPVENFFGQLRQHGGRNTNPTVQNFKQFFKTLLLNNFVTRHSLSANCEIDQSVNIISSVKRFVTQGVPEEIEYTSEEFDALLVNIYISEMPLTYVDTMSVGYVSGFISKKIKSLNSCMICKNNVLCRDKLNQWHDLCVAKEFKSSVPNKLRYCTPNFVRAIAQIYNFFKLLVLKFYRKRYFLNILIYFLKKNVDFSFQECEHSEDTKAAIIKHFATLCCHNWAEGINRILRGTDTRYRGTDMVYKAAMEYYNKRKKNKEK